MHRTQKLTITFHSEDEIRAFVDICTSIDDAIDIHTKKMATDAKSIMGMLLLPLEEELPIGYECYDDENNYEEFRDQIVGKFDVHVTDLES